MVACHASRPSSLRSSSSRRLPQALRRRVRSPESSRRALAVPHVAKSRSSALAVDLTDGKLLYAHNLGLPLIPASNEKLAVTYASLLALGPSYRFSTDVLGEGELDGVVWRGDIVLKGYGDPTLSTLDLLSLASQLRSQESGGSAATSSGTSPTSTRGAWDRAGSRTSS